MKHWIAAGALAVLMIWGQMPNLGGGVIAGDPHIDVVVAEQCKSMHKDGRPVGGQNVHHLDDQGWAQEWAENLVASQEAFTWSEKFNCYGDIE